MYYPDKPSLTREQFVNLLEKTDKDLYNNLVNHNYKFWQASTCNLADGLAQKCIYDNNGNKLFYIDCYLYIYDQKRFPHYPDDQKRINCNMEVHYYLENDENKYCTLQLHINDLDYAEKFFLEFFYKHNCSMEEKVN